MNAPAVFVPKLEFTEDGRKIYKPDGRVLCDFIVDRSHVSVIRGPWGSGKTLAVINKIWALACEQAPSPLDGLRKTRWGIVRNTYGELKNTTLKDFLSWFPPEEYGQLWLSKPIEFHMRMGDVQAEMIFIALDTAEDVSKLNSTQFTGFWFHEMQFSAKEVFDDAEGRTGRFPAMMDGGPTWHGVLGDMNEPGEDHWIVQMTGEVPFPADMTADEKARLRWPKEWAYFVQPPALVEEFGPDGKTVARYRVNPKGENLLWLPRGFYGEKARGKSKAWIDSRLMNRISLFVEGKPVWPQFQTEVHVAQHDLRPQPGYPILIGLDFGRSPAAVFAQFVNNRWIILDEIVGFDMGAIDFAPMVKRKLDDRFGGYSFRLYGDPKGQDKTQTDERTSYDIFESFGMTVEPAPIPAAHKQIQTLIDTVTYVLRGMDAGVPRLLLDPHRPRTLKVAMAGKYHFERVKTGSGETKETPKKDKYSHVADALSLLLISGGEGRAMVGRPVQERARPVQTRLGRRSLRRRVA